MLTYMGSARNNRKSKGILTALGKFVVMWLFAAVIALTVVGWMCE